MFDAGGTYVFAPPVPDDISQLLVVEPGVSSIELTLPYHFGRSIGLEFSPDLSEGSWLELGNFARQGDLLVFSDRDLGRVGSRRGFYRAFLRPLAEE